MKTEQCGVISEGKKRRRQLGGRKEERKEKRQEAGGNGKEKRKRWKEKLTVLEQFLLRDLHIFLGNKAITTTFNSINALSLLILSLFYLISLMKPLLSAASQCVIR